jgi:spore germination protein GerM
MIVLLLLTLGLAAGCADQLPAAVPPEVPKDHGLGVPGDVVGDTMPITVYFATKDARFLMPEVRVVPKTTQPAHKALELLLGEPQSRQLTRVMPEGVKVRSVAVNDHIAYVDFSDKLLKISGGSAQEILLVAAVVDTLTEFPEISQVQFLVDGKKIDTLGSMDVAEPLSRSEQIIKKSL